MNAAFARKLCIAAFALCPPLVLPAAAQPPAPPAAAQPPTAWSLAGAGCVPTGQTASSIGTFNSAGDSKFVVGRTGEIILTCPVPSSLTAAAFIGMTYRDPDGRGGVTRVRAVLRQKALDNGAVADVAWTRLDSNARPPAPATVRTSAILPGACDGGRFVFNHDAFTYYIQVNMTRSAASGDVLLASVDLGRSLIC